MKKVLFVLTIGLLSGIMLQSCRQSDEKLQTQVIQTIQMAVPEVSAVVKDGVATLSGEVESEEAKTTVERLAREVRGIRSVVNNVTVREPEPPVITQSDETIKTAIENQLKDAGIENVFVEVNDGEVILTGEVKQSDLTRIMQIASESNPVKVTNNLNLK